MDTHTILIVNDTPDQLELMDAILGHAGYRVLAAGGGREGLETARRARPDLIISDVAMPEVDGIELCRRLRSETELRGVPVLLVSALRKDSADVVEGLRVGADDYLQAPYDPTELLARAARLLERRGAQEELERRVAERTAQLEASNQALEREIAERKQTEQKLREQAALIDLVYAAVIVRDTGGSIVYWNRSAVETYGWSVEEALGKVSDALLQTQFPIPPGEVEAVLFGGAGRWQGELRHVRRDGAEIVVESRQAVVRDARGNPTAILEVNRDITERRQAEEALRQAEEQLRQSQKLEAVGQLAGGIAHDFNNLLTAILGQSELLLRQLADDPLRRKVEEIKKAGDRAALLTYQLLAFSRKQILQPKVLDLNAVVSEMDKILQRLIEENIDIRLVLDPRLGRVEADPGQISQVIVNLTVNARDAMPQGGRITVETANVYLDEEYAGRHVAVRPGRYVMLAVSDTGCGIDAETQKHVFEPFFTTKKVGKGTGLGLSTVYGIVKQSGGNVWVYSEVGRGTTFKIYLPRVEDGVEPAAVVTDERDLPRGTETILLVEDEEAVRTLAREILESCGYTVLEAADGAEAVAICEDSDCAIDLLVTDVVMPHMNGREVAKRVTALRPQLRVLFMSGYTENAIVHHGVLDEGAQFIAKPFSLEELAYKVRELLDGAHDGKQGG